MYFVENVEYGCQSPIGCPEVAVASNLVTDQIVPKQNTYFTYTQQKWTTTMDWQYNQSHKQRRNPYLEEEDGQRDPPPHPSKPASMSSWLSRATSSTQAQFAATAIVSGAVVAGAILGYQHIRRQERVEDLKSSIPELGQNHHAEKVGLDTTSCVE